MKELIDTPKGILEIEIYGKGQPVLFFTGLNSHLSEFREISKVLKQDYRCILFNRPGLGKSTINTDDLNVSHTCEVVHEMLKVKNISDKLILVGHSHGGLCVQRYVQMYEKEVKGLLLIDAMPTDNSILDGLATTRYTDELEGFLIFCKKMKDLDSKDIKKEIDIAEYNEELKEFYSSPSLYKAMYHEVSNWRTDTDIIEESFKQLKLPLMVLGRDKQYNIKNLVDEGISLEEAELLESTWHKLIEDQGKISEISKVHFVEEADHKIHLCKPSKVIESIHLLDDETFIKESS